MTKKLLLDILRGAVFTVLFVCLSVGFGFSIVALIEAVSAK